MGYGYGTACCYAAGYEGAGEGSHQYMLLKTSQNLNGAYPSVVDMFLLYATAARKLGGSRGSVLAILVLCRLLPLDHGHKKKRFAEVGVRQVNRI